MAEWSRCHKITLNTRKCEVAFFTNNLKEARWQPSLQLDGTTLNTTSLPNFLGVTIDRALSFGPHVAAVVSEASNWCRVLTSLTFKRWGWRKDQLLKVYRTRRTISNEVDSYGGRGWLTSIGGVIGESGSGAKFSALTARLRCQDCICRAKPSKRSTDKQRPRYKVTCYPLSILSSSSKAAAFIPSITSHLWAKATMPPCRWILPCPIYQLEIYPNQNCVTTS